MSICDACFYQFTERSCEECEFNKVNIERNAIKGKGNVNMTEAEKTLMWFEEHIKKTGTYPLLSEIKEKLEEAALNDKRLVNNVEKKLEIEWLPINTAPKDGTIVLVCNKDHYEPESAYFGTYHPNAKGKKYWRSCNMGTKINPTHWMKLPQPPLK